MNITFIKRGLAVLAAVCLAASLSACGARPAKEPSSTAKNSGKSAYALLKEAGEKEKGAVSYDADYTMKIEMGDGASSITMGVEGSMKVKGLKNDPEIHTDMAVSFFGQKMSMSTYYVNGTYYVDSNGSKMRTSKPVEEVLKQYATGAQSDIKESDIRSSGVTTENGTTIVSLTVDGRALTDMVGGALDSSLGSNAEGIDYAALFTFSDAEMEVRLDEKGTLLNDKFTIEMKVNPAALSELPEESAGAAAMYENMIIKVTTEMTYNSIGLPVSIVPPADLDAYTDSDSLSL